MATAVKTRKRVKKTAVPALAPAPEPVSKKPYNADGVDYDNWLQTIERYAHRRIMGHTVFVTAPPPQGELFDIYLSRIPMAFRQHSNCNACRRFVNRYGGLVVIENDLSRSPVLWDPAWAPALYFDAVKALHDIVSELPIESQFFTDKKVIGEPETGVWHHLSLSLPDGHCSINLNRLLSAEQLMAQSKENYRMLYAVLGLWNKSVLATAEQLLRSGQIDKSEKFQHTLSSYMEMREEARRFLRSSQGYKDTLWKFVAEGNDDVCHLHGSALGSFLDDLYSGTTPAQAVRSFNEKLDPLKYMRPQAAPGAGNVAQAAKIVEKLGIENSLRRRYVHLDEIQALWRPRQRDKAKEFGIFAGVVTKIEPVVTIPGETAITFAKFRRDVLPGVREMELYTNGPGNYGALLTEAIAGSAPILKWDHPEWRNPVSWYVYTPHGMPGDFNLPNYGWVDVTALCLSPQMWKNEDEAYGLSRGVMFVLKDAWIRKLAGSALFPEILKSELMPVRATIEAFSNSNMPDPVSDPVCGVMLQESRNSTSVLVRCCVESRIQQYRIDRWE
jgi:hypothetical protein